MQVQAPGFAVSAYASIQLVQSVSAAPTQVSQFP